MAYRRSICTRATLYARRFNPSFSYISHDRDDNKKGNEEGNFQKNDNFSNQRRGFGTYMSKLSGPGIVFQQQSAGFGGIGNGVGCYRYMSTSIGEGVDKAEYLNDFAEVITGGPVEAIASQAPVLSEVAIAAADSAIPVAALQYVIEGVHSFTGLSWAASIALTTLLIRGATVPFLINQLKSTSKLSIMRPRLEEIKEEMEAKVQTIAPTYHDNFNAVDELLFFFFSRRVSLDQTDTK
ncbi:hypothetical protein KSS87_006882 [Heliosperma pusillum]|nr:hypothetical protein KSS87_006882 [Heliosperma pusillum]